VLGGVLSPLNKWGPEQISIQKLKERIAAKNIQEIVIALDSTLEGDATALFIKQELASYPVTISRLAFGLPMGSSLDYVDGGTLARALSGRNKF
jgi:recombination protein RecR